MKVVALFVVIYLGCLSSHAQTGFWDIQKSAPRFMNVLKSKDEILAKAFEKAYLHWPPKQIYIRSFKYDSELEVWARGKSDEAYQLFKTYRICALSGTLGPKRMDGDYQVPEGFYHLVSFNPKSDFHMALGIDYPNCSDQLLSDSIRPGKGILIHGSCVTQGCIPLQNDQIEELYLLAAYAHAQGQDFIPVHIFPVRFDVEKSSAYLKRVSRGDDDYQRLTGQLKKLFDYFESYKKLPVIATDMEGNYQIF